MTELDDTRRAFIRTAAAGAALIGPLVLLGACSPSGMAGAAAGGQASAALAKIPDNEAALWDAVVGQQFQLSGADGIVSATLSAVVREASIGDRPAELRQVPLSLSFTFDHASAVAGDTLYALSRGVAGEALLYMQRGADPNGAAMLTALLN